MKHKGDKMTHKIEKELNFLLTSTDKMMSNNFTRKLKDEGINITFEQYTILTILWDNKDLCQYNLAKLTGRDEASTSRIINTLIKNEFIIRQTCITDKRIRRIKLTKKGESIKNTVLNISNKCLNEAITGMSQKEYEAGINFLDNLRKNLNNINSNE
ncbi:MarR family transcriptional regulator [Clostridium sp. CH2]|uniref:MarR family winged helix-turn-helix transcriptional regulator n=1 Tax=Clostridium sp. CH2 TaxID=2949990 RepID=UPI0020799BEF|nr:MarR family transcriptional regulator [Clostridium sp. CH2]